MGKNLNEEFRKRYRKDSVKAGFRMIFIALLFFVSYMKEHDLSMKHYFEAPKEIVAGTDLEQYLNQEVRCEVTCVVNSVVNVHKSSDPEKKTYMCGYVATDEAYENPFMVFVPVEKQSLMQEIRQRFIYETYYEMYGIEPRNESKTVLLEGHVRELENEKWIQYYKDALNEVYGNEYATEITDIYYIDDENVAAGRTNVEVVLLVMVLVAAGSYMVVGIWKILRSIGDVGQKNIERFRMHHGISIERLDYEFQKADEVADGFYVSQEYTFGTGRLNNCIIKNSDIVWMYFKRDSIRNYGIFAISIYTKDKKKIRLERRVEDGKKILAYYEQNFPHIVIGDNAKLRRLFQKNYNAFLQLKYRNIEMCR